MYEFQYHQPASIEEAKEILAANDEAKILAGGMTLLPTMKMRLAQPSDLVDLSGIEALYGIEDHGDALQIGAMVTHANVVASEVVNSELPALADVADSIGDPQVRNRGTLGGSVANSDPAADYPAALLALAAEISTDHRSISADDFFVSMFETALEPGEIVRAVSFRKAKRAAYAKFPNPASRYAVVGVMVAELDSGVRVAVTGAGGNAFRATALEAALNDEFSATALDGLSVDGSEFNSDLHASAEYRAHLLLVMAKRAVHAAGG